MSELSDAVTKYYRLEERIRDLLGKKVNWGSECGCNDPDTVDFVTVEGGKGFETFCINCGGYQNE